MLCHNIMQPPRPRALRRRHAPGSEEGTEPGAFTFWARLDAYAIMTVMHPISVFTEDIAMRKIALLLAALMLMCFACAESAGDTIHLRFEEGFSLDVPAGWAAFDVPEELAEADCTHCLGAPDGSRLMYVQQTEFSGDHDALRDALLAQGGVTVTSDMQTQAGTRFLVFETSDGTVSGCATLCGGTALRLLFLPKSDAEYLVTAAAIMESFRPE